MVSKKFANKVGIVKFAVIYNNVKKYIYIYIYIMSNCRKKNSITKKNGIDNHNKVELANYNKVCMVNYNK